jgi:hypothetical protein
MSKPCGLHLTARADLPVKAGERERERVMQLKEVDTIQDLKIWVGENMQGATVEEGEGGIVIRTNLVSTMGGYLHERGGENE